MVTSRLQEYSWQVCFLASLSVGENALRRTSFKVQTVKAGHPQTVHDTIMYSLRLIMLDVRRPTLAIFQHTSRFAQSITLLQVFSAVLFFLSAYDGDARF